MLSNYPIAAFDAKEGLEPRWPTFGVKLSSHPEDLQGIAQRIRGPVSMSRAMIRTWTGFFDQMHVDSLDAQARTIFIRTNDIARSTEFGLTSDQSKRLHERGQRAAEKFLDKWNFHAFECPWRQRCVTPSPVGVSGFWGLILRLICHMADSARRPISVDMHRRPDPRQLS